MTSPHTRVSRLARARPLSQVADMRVLNRCMLGVTVLLLMCEVIISQLCKSLITMVDGFHTLYLLIRMALPPPASIQKAAPSPPCDNSSLSQRPSTSSAALHCGLSYRNTRIQTVGFFISALFLNFLSIAYCMEILCFIQHPHPVQRPLVPVVIATFSLLQKMLMLRLSLGQQMGDKETKSDLEVSGKVSAEDEADSQAKQERVLEVQSTVNSSLHNGMLAICNLESSSDHDRNAQTPDPQLGVHLCKAAGETEPTRTTWDRWDCEAVSRVSDMKTCTYGLQSAWCKDNTYIRCLKSQSTAELFMSSCSTERSLPDSLSPACLPSFITVTQNLWSSVLALISSLVMLLLGPGCCDHLLYLDPGLSLLSVVVLLAIALPQLHRYGLILMQATPPDICVSDLQHLILSVPGVQAVHELHVWQLRDSCTVTSVHIRCHAWFPANRCADVMSGVTKVLQNAGVSCCTVQPEFPACSSPKDKFAVGSPAIHREALSLTAVLACSLSCGNACRGKMCCSAMAEECRDPLEAPAGETDKETLVINNAFL
ncbi:uncharacterized protein LOC117509506 [Thalassophryne amazonica]|uniref:uncharacterized protein LOC117509506 n=1 Tax=Thalassophryne amazonica TaxID=390379 RepID=UPI001472626D|nr:uncharacterized protein LOC117509506 [Thalassophryne amazonica]